MGGAVVTEGVGESGLVEVPPPHERQIGVGLQLTRPAHVPVAEGVIGVGAGDAEMVEVDCWHGVQGCPSTHMIIGQGVGLVYLHSGVVQIPCVVVGVTDFGLHISGCHPQLESLGIRDPSSQSRATMVHIIPVGLQSGVVHIPGGLTFVMPPLQLLFTIPLDFSPKNPVGGRLFSF